MRAVYSKPGPLIRGWWDALRDLGDNPLAQYWHSLDLQAARSRAWHERSPMLLLLGLALALPAFQLLLLMLRDLRSQPADSLSRQHLAATYFEAAALLLAALALLISWAWLLQRFGRCCMLALAFLEPAGASSARRSLDDLLAVSRLSEQELVCGLLRHCLSRLLLPLSLSVAALGLAVYCAGQVTVLQSFYRYDTQSLPGPGMLALVLAATWLSGLLGAVCSLLSLVSLSLGRRATPLPFTGAFAQSATQLLLGAGLAAAMLALPPVRTSSSPGGEEGSLLGPVLVFAWMLGLLLFYLARRWTWLRFVLAHGILGPLLILLLPVFAIELLAQDEFVVSAVLSGGIFLVQMCFCIFQPLLACAWLAGSGSEFLMLFALLIPLQLLSIFVLAGLARDAVQRRKWEAQ